VQPSLHSHLSAVFPQPHTFSELASETIWVVLQPEEIIGTVNKRAATPKPVNRDLFFMSSPRVLVAIDFRLIGAVDRNAKIVCLLSCQRRQMDTQFAQMQPRNLFVYFLWKRINLAGFKFSG
jgi:hypothetical protein